MNRRALLAAAALSGIALPACAQAPRRFEAAASYSAQRGGAGLVIMRHGIPLAEDYPGGGNARLPLGAASKVFALLLAASLVEDRRLTLDQPASMVLGEWGAHPVKSLITIRALLNGTSGLALDRQQAVTAAALALEPVASPGQRFVDDPAPYLILGEIARRALSGIDPATYLTTRTLGEISCVPVGWARTPDGAARFDDGATVSARNLTQVGELIRREGIWRGSEVVDANTLRDARLSTFAESHVGMGLYLASGDRGRGAPNVESDLWRMNPNPPQDLVMAAGDGGQRLYIIPSRSMVIVRLAQNLDGRDWSDAMFLSLLLHDT